MRKILETAHKQIGVKEHPAGSNNVLYNTWFYSREVYDGDKLGAHYPWCGTFVSWVFAQAGVPLGNIDFLKGFASCPYAVDNMAKWAKLIDRKDVQPGDILFFSWDGHHIEHTGIFENAISAEIFASIEGNTSLGNDSNGGEVMQRQRRWSNVKAIARPNSIILEV